MPKCNICGGKATIFDGDRWWCEHHYKRLKNKAEKTKRSNKPDGKKLPRIDLGLAKI